MGWLPPYIPAPTCEETTTAYFTGPNLPNTVIRAKITMPRLWFAGGNHPTIIHRVSRSLLSTTTPNTSALQSHCHHHHWPGWFSPSFSFYFFEIIYKLLYHHQKAAAALLISLCWSPSSDILIFPLHYDFGTWESPAKDIRAQRAPWTSAKTWTPGMRHEDCIV